MIVEQNVPLQPHNTFGIVAKARALVRVRGEADVQQLLADGEYGAIPKFVLGGGSNIVLTGDVKPLVLKVEVPGRRVVEDGPRATLLEAGAGENWHEFVTWSLEQGFPGLENLALIPGTVGAAPVQNVGAYGVELQDRFESLDAIDLFTGKLFTLNAAQCAFGYRDSVFKHVAAKEGDFGLGGRALILRVRFRLPKPWKPELGYLDLQRKIAGNRHRRALGAANLRLGLRRPRGQAARPAGDRQRRQFLQEPHGDAGPVPGHHRPRAEHRSLPDARRQREAGGRLADRCLRLEGQIGGQRRRL